MLRERCRFSLTPVGNVLFAVGGSGGSSDDLEFFDADGHQVSILRLLHLQLQRRRWSGLERF
jgi:hypothetical protein